MDNKYLKKEILNFDDLEKNKKVRKLFDFLFSINSSSDKEKYNLFINVWNESEKDYSFFKREQFNYSKVKDFYYISYDEKEKSYIASGELGKVSFSTFDALWEHFDTRKFNVIFYCYDFENLSRKIKAFFEKTWFINTKKQFVQENQWKFILYKDKINGFFLNRCTTKNNESKKWEMFFLPVEDETFISEGVKDIVQIKNYDLYKISLEILIIFIVTIYSKNNDNFDKFINELNKTKNELHNKAVINEFDLRVKSLFTNRSETKCIKSIIWIAIIKWNNKDRFIEEWALNKNIKLNSNNFLKYMENNIDSLSEGIIGELLIKKAEFINILKGNEISSRNVFLFPKFNCGFKKYEIEQSSFAIFNNNLFNIYFDDEWEFKNKYLFDALLFYIVNSIKASRDQITYKIDKVRILNPLYMKWVEINIDKLNKFVKDNFKTDLLNIQNDIRKMLNGE
ncbi:MAG: hypothetical protein ACRC8C_02925 [Mycoplasmoidaceae bacterium]